MTRTVAAVLVGVALLAIVAGSVRFGYRWADGIWEKRENERVAAVNAERVDQARRLEQAHAEVERLRARPERVRTVTQEVVRYVQADAVCPSLPDSWRRLWNAEPDDRAPAGTAGVDDDGVRPVAAAAGG